jgi:hypothetical protein
MNVQLYSNIGVGQINGLVTHTRYQNCSKFAPSKVFKDKVFVFLWRIAIHMWHFDRSINVFDKWDRVADNYGAITTLLVHFYQIDQCLDFIGVNTIEKFA